MSLLTMRTKLRALLGNPTVSEIADVRLNEWVNSAYKDVALKYRFKRTRKVCVFNTVIGTSKYGLPADVYSILSAYDETNKRKLEKVGWQQLDEQESTETGKPLFYATFRSYIQLVPAADGVYTTRVRYKVQAVALVNDNDIMLIPSVWEDPVTFYARWWAWEELQEFEKSKHALNAYKILVAEIPDEMTEEAGDFDSGVEMPHLASGGHRQLDFDHSDDRGA